jgi:hypothetical protein
VAALTLTASRMQMQAGGPGVLSVTVPVPAIPAGSSDVVFDLFTTGMWLGHLIFWLPWLVLGAALGRPRVRA